MVGGLKVWETVMLLDTPMGLCKVGILPLSSFRFEGIVTVGTCIELVRVVCADDGVPGRVCVATGIAPGCWNWSGIRAGPELTFCMMYTG